MMQLLQQGSVALVYKDTYNESHSTIAIKTFRNAESERCRREALNELNVLRRLQEGDCVERESYVVKLIGFTMTSTQMPILYLELCEQGDLYELHQSGILPASNIPFYAAELILALDFLASRNVLHGDLKPENIGVTSSGHLRILDFGVSKILGHDKTVVHGSGTLVYASPEVLRRAPCTLAADWWSLGAILFELVFHQTPFDGNTTEDQVSNIVDDDPSWPTPLLPQFGSAVQFLSRLLTKDPSNRLSTFAECQNQSFFETVDWNAMRTELWSP